MLGFITVWLIIYFVWWIIYQVMAYRAFKEFNETVNSINIDIKRIAHTDNITKGGGYIVPTETPFLKKVREMSPQELKNIQVSLQQNKESKRSAYTSRYITGGSV